MRSNNEVKQLGKNVAFEYLVVHLFYNVMCGFLEFTFK